MNEDPVPSLLARIDERTENIQHRVRSIEMKFEGYATTRDLKHAIDRLDAVEANIAKAAWAIIGAWISGFGVVLSMLLKRF